MADFAVWGAAIAETLGYSQEDFLEAYTANIRQQTQEVLEGHAVAAAVLALMEGREEWTGTPAALLKELDEFAEAADHVDGIDGDRPMGMLRRQAVDDNAASVTDAGMLVHVLCTKKPEMDKDSREHVS